MPQRMVRAACIGKQCVMAAGLDNPAAVEHGNLVAEAAGRQAVADVDGGLVPGDLVEAAVYLVFRHRV